MAKSDGYQPGPTVIREPPTGGTGVISPSFHVSVTIGHPEAHGLESLTVTGIPSGTKDVTLNMRDIPEWISVEDRLPEAGDMWNGLSFVAVLYPHRHDQDASRVGVDTTMRLRNRITDPRSDERKPTHWYPILDLPEVMF